VRAEAVRRSKTSILAIVALAALAGCAPLAKVRDVNPTLGAQYGSHAEQAIAAGQKLQQTEPEKALGCYLRGVELATAELPKNAKDSLAVNDYNFALSRVFSVIRDAHLNPWTHPLQVPGCDGGTYSVIQHPARDSRWRPQDYDLIPADNLDVRGKFIGPRVIRDGIGAPLVAVRTTYAPTLRQPFLPPRLYLSVTAVARFTGRHCEIEFINALSSETVSVAGRTLPSAGDFTAPLALGLSREHPEKIGLPALLNPDEFADKARIIQVQPYEREKIPVLFVHGLQETPVSWIPMVNALSADPVIRHHYQAWVFSYPSGYPIQYSALLLRRELDALNRSFPNHRRIILVGHSMGGILCRLMITDSDGDRLWRYFFGKTPAQTRLSPESKALVKEALIFKPRREVARVIFIATPHRGSEIAQGPIGRFASSLIHKPMQFVRLGPEIMQASVAQEEPGVFKLKRIPNSIDTLAPNDAFVQVMNTLPLAKSAPYHSIIGDRGRGDTPNSSDGVVPYWSSHLQGAESEKIVPSNHGAHQSQPGIAEVIRILRERSASGGSGKRPRSGLRRIEIRYDSSSGSSTN